MAHLRETDNAAGQSLMSVLNKFVDAVNKMDDKVMVPCRLRDMDLSQTGASSGSPDDMSLLPVSSCHGEDLYNHYVMINAIKSEIINGGGPVRVTERSSSHDSDTDVSSEVSSEDGEEDEADTSRKTAAMFRHHIQGLFGLLNQLTDTAKYLGDAYEQQVGGFKKVKSFAI